MNGPKKAGRSVLRDVTEAKGGVGALAKAAGVSRESLYRTLSKKGNPKIETLTALLYGLGLKLAVAPRETA